MARYIPKKQGILSNLTNTAKLLAENTSIAPMAVSIVGNRTIEGLKAFDEGTSYLTAKVRLGVRSMIKEDGVDPNSVDLTDTDAVLNALIQAEKDEEAKRVKREAFFKLQGLSIEKAEELKELESAWNKLSDKQKEDPLFKNAYEGAQQEILSLK